MKISRLLTGLFFLWATSAIASGGGSEPAAGINYIPITPALIVNYGGPSTRVRFIKAELSIRTETGEDAKEILHHIPIIRDRLISIFSAQTEETLSSAEGKEKLRLLALAEINAAVHSAEFGEHPEASGAGEEKTPEKVDKKNEKADKEDKKSDKKKGKNKKGEGDEHAEGAPAPEHKKGPASDLFFNNFVVQK